MNININKTVIVCKTINIRKTIKISKTIKTNYLLECICRTPHCPCTTSGCTAEHPPPPGSCTSAPPCPPSAPSWVTSSPPSRRHSHYLIRNYKMRDRNKLRRQSSTSFWRDMNSRPSQESIGWPRMHPCLENYSSKELREPIVPL